MAWDYPGLAGRRDLVSSCVIVGQETPLRGTGYGQIADRIGAEPAVHRTACSSPGCGSHPARRRRWRAGRSRWPPGAARDGRGSRRNGTALILMVASGMNFRLEPRKPAPRWFIASRQPGTGGPGRPGWRGPLWAVTGPLSARSPLTSDGPDVYLRWTWHVHRRLALVTAGGRRP